MVGKRLKSKRGKVWALALVLSASMLVLAACAPKAGDEGAETPEPTEELSLTCSWTEIAAIGPIIAVRGEDRVPTGFDPINSANCTFTKPIASITLELLREGEITFNQTIALDPASADVPFPLPRDLVAVVPPDLETGRYDRRMQATSTEGETIEVIEAISSYFQGFGVLWVFDVGMSPESAAREALLEIAEKLGVAPNVPQLIVFEPVDWPDTSLGCPEPDRFYAQVITPGFRLVFEHTVGTEVQQYEYHTNEDGSIVVFCEQID